jgi:CsoR family transcriptional regulator, copper-sensing transcriptional repressor
MPPAHSPDLSSAHALVSAPSMVPSVNDHPHDESGQHVHSEESRKRIINRLARIEGHIRGIKTMVQEDRPCPDVLIQVAAVRGGLDRVARIILDEHLSECITRAVSEGNVEAEIAALKTALDRFI